MVDLPSNVKAGDPTDFRPAPTVDQYSDMRPRAGSVSTDNPDFEGKRIGLDFQAEIPDMRPAGEKFKPFDETYRSYPWHTGRMPCKEYRLVLTSLCFAKLS
jgi:hypothetical protein